MADNEIEIVVKGKDVSASKTFDDVKSSANDAVPAIDRVGDGIDNTGSKAGDLESGFRGVTDSMSGFSAIAKGDVMGGLTDLAGGAEALATGFSGVLIPALKASKVGMAVSTAATKAQTAAMRVLNLVMRANPIGLIITALVALVTIMVVAYKKSETFRRIVDGAFRAVQKGASFAINWVKAHWPLLLAILTGPFGLAVLVIVRKRDAIVGAFKSVPGKIRGFFSGLGSIITSPFTSAFGIIKNWWNATIGGFGFTVPDWVPKVGGNEFRIPEMARGGIRGGLAIVGERGRELVRLPQGSTVLPNGQTERMLAGRGGGGDEFAPVYLMLDNEVVWQGLLKLKRKRRIDLGLA